MLGGSRIVRKMDMVLSLYQVEINMLVNGKMGKKVVREHLRLRMEMNTSGNG